MMMEDEEETRMRLQGRYLLVLLWRPASIKHLISQLLPQSTGIASHQHRDQPARLS